MLTVDTRPGMDYGRAMTTQTEANVFTVETMAQVDNRTVNFYGHASITDAYMRASFTAKTTDDLCFLFRLADDLKRGHVPLSPEYDNMRDEYWFSHLGWTFPIERLFDWR